MPLFASCHFRRFISIAATNASRSIRSGRFPSSKFACVIAFVGMAFVPVCRADDVVPHGQEQAPGPALSPQEALKRMTVPPGFHVELVASEPDIVNPVAMTFDESGRIWISESLEYPRREPGPGRDRVKVLEDTDNDGAADKFTVFADGLNIPSGIAVGGGGVWVANSPDILLLKDTDGDGSADSREVVVTGFGRDDTHELPNSLTWGPDGWLYGLNGVFNASRVEHQGKVHEFTCALFRIHPRTREFELFAEGTSNPWGVAFDGEGSAFVSACVIDHLWHLVQTGYYHRQGGPYPPHTWKIESIVTHKHQKAAYCGIHYFDSEEYPRQYRDKLYMGNIHGNCVNCDSLSRNGSTYSGTGEPDFLSANDSWFMPVVQKTGPDGCLYILDWYDRYHCYQDANRDPQGIDRGKGRLYRVRYGDGPRPTPLRLGELPSERLVDFLGDANVYVRDQAQRLLWERAEPAIGDKLAGLVFDDTRPTKQRMHALWALLGSGPLEADFHERLLQDDDASFRAWGVRAAGNHRKLTDRVRQAVAELADDPSPDVRLQVAIAARKVEGLDPLAVLVAVGRSSSDDPLIPHIVWQNLLPLLDHRGEALLAQLSAADAEPMGEIIARAFDRMLDDPSRYAHHLGDFLAGLASGSPAADELVATCLASLRTRVQNHEVPDGQLPVVKAAFAWLKNKGRSTNDAALAWEATLLSASLGDEDGRASARTELSRPGADVQRRRQAAEALVASQDPQLLVALAAVFNGDHEDPTFQGELLATLGRNESPQVADLVLGVYHNFPPEFKPQAIELLTGRAAWSRKLLAAIADNRLPPEALNLNQVRKLLATGDAEIASAVQATWGTLRTERDHRREQVIFEMRNLLRRHSGDPLAGRAVFRKVCGQCHKLFGEGQEVGPDITANGRNSMTQLLSNVFDPSLVIGAAYQARTVVTADGRVLTGLLAEDSDQRIVLKVQGGKLETVARADVDELAISPLSLMPEDLEKQLKPQEMADLFALLTLDRPPEDTSAKLLPGAGGPIPQATQDEAEFHELLAEFAPGFQAADVGEGGLEILANYRGREGVLRTHPADQKRPCVLSSHLTLPAERRARLVLTVTCDTRWGDNPGDWRLLVKVDGAPIHDQIVGAKTTSRDWQDVSIDLTPWAGKTIRLELANAANNWSYEFGYWGAIELVYE